MQQKEINFNNLPEAIGTLLFKVERLEQLLNEKNSSQVQQPQDQLLSIDEACNFLNLSKQTIYGLSFRNEIPKIKVKKKLYFSRESLMKWLKSKESKALNNVGGTKYEV